jgi:hypothetical protein
MAKITKKNYLKQLKLHEAQWQVHASPARFKVLVAGRRTGKSRLMLTEVVNKCVNFSDNFDLASPPVVLLGMPSLKQARAVHWQSILNILTDHPLVKKIYRSDFRIQFKGLRPDLLVRGCNDGNGDSLRGLKIYFAGLDEFQDIKPQVWEEVVYPALSDTPNSQALLIGTPKMSNIYFKRLFDLAPERADWESFHFTTYDNKYFPRERLEEAKILLPPKIFEQEYMASWVSFGGQIFSELESDHFIDESSLPPIFDTAYCGVDWGDINPATVIVAKKNGIYYLVDYWLNPHANTAVSLETHLKHTLELCLKWNVERAFADPSSPTKVMEFRKGGIPKLITGLNAIDTGNSIINSLLYQRRLFISSRCQKVYEQMIGYHREEKDGIITEKVAQGQEDHVCDATRYVLATLEHKRIFKGLYLEDKSAPVIDFGNDNRLYH